MKKIQINTTNVYENLATEEALFLHTTDEVLLLWRNQSSVIIGRNQEPLVEVDLEYAQTENIPIARRLTGGGAVYHDLGNINVSYIFTCDDENFDDKVRQFLDLFIAYLQSIGLAPMLTGRNDICVRDAEGNLRKISGTAMTQKGNRGLFHLCLLFDADMDVMERVLTPSADKLTSKGVDSVRSRTVNVKALHPRFDHWTADTFFDHINTYFADCAAAADLPPALTSAMNNLRTNRYENSQWIYNRKYRKENNDARNYTETGSL